MKSLSVKRIGTLAIGALMLGASLAAPATALFDETGLTKGFFYDSNYNPVVQVVVGEKGLASDSVAAGNIAATIGNLAYYTKPGTATGTVGSSTGQVKIGVSAIGASGKFEQEDDSLTHLTPGFYDNNNGLVFSDETYDYQKGEFVSYSLACDSQRRSESGILKEGTYTNIHCLFCETLCLESLENPDHDMTESIVIDSSNGQIRWYEDGLGKDDEENLIMEIDKDTIQYVVDTGEIPLTEIKNDDTKIDFEWRGKFLLFGDEYYVKDADKDEIDLAKGRTLDDISSEGYTSEYLGYKFKIDHLIYSNDYEVAGILLDVEKPDGTVVQTQISKRANGIVDDIEIAGVYAEESNAVATANLLVYDTGTNINLKDGEDI
jgi:S-layer protein (TIGR01564 family)